MIVMNVVENNMNLCKNASNFVISNDNNSVSLRPHILISPSNPLLLLLLLLLIFFLLIFSYCFPSVCC